MPTLLVLFLVLLIRLSHANLCLTLDPPGPFLVSLSNNSAALTLDVSLCPNASITVSASPSVLTPSVSVQSLRSTSDACHTLRATLDFQSHIGSGKLIFATANCTISARVVVAGIIVYHLPSRDLVASSEAQPILIPAPRQNSVSVSFAVKTVLSTGETFRTRKAINALEVSLFPPIPSVTATLGVGDHSGNLHIVSTDDGSDVPRPQVVQIVKLRNTKSGATAFFRIIHAPLVAIVRAVKAPARLSPAGGERITMVVRRGGADQRRLVIGNVTVIETEYVRRGDKHLSSFISPLLPWGRYKWRMELVTRGNVTVADDSSGHIFIVASKPILTSILPAVVRPGTDGFVIISGTFHDSVVIFIDGEPIPSGDVVHKASGEIIMHLPRMNPTFNGTLTISVRSVRGKKSNSLGLKFDPDAVHVDAVVAHASATQSNGPFVIPLVCNHSEPPVIFARADTPQDVYEPPSFNFSVRTSASPGLSFKTLSSGTNGMVPLDADLFREDEVLEEDFVTVLVVVAQGEHSGATLVLISRRLRRDVIGVTILPPFDAQRGTGRAVLEAQVSSLIHCRNSTNFETRTVWSINKRTIIASDSDDAGESPTEDSAVAVEFGRSLVVPDVNGFSYAGTVDVIDKLTGNTIATGSSKSRGKLRSLAPSLRTFLNGGLTSITLGPEVKSYEIHSSVYDGAIAISSGQLRYSWVCKSLSPETSACSETLFPVTIRKTRKATRFNVTTIGIRERTAVEYYLTVSLGSLKVGSARLRLSFNPVETAMFPSSKISAGASVPQVSPNGSMQFLCYHQIILAILDSPVKDSYSFALFQEGNDTNVLETFAGDLLVSHSGYWSPQERNGVMFGIVANKLEAGTYTLYGRRNGQAGPGGGASWTFQIQRCPVLVPHKLPFLSGTAGLTSFLAGASSVPPSRNLFFFELTRQDEGSTAPDTSLATSAFSPKCSGGQICHFVVSAPGRYVLRVDMYDPSGTRNLASETLQTPITVLPPNTTDTEFGSTGTKSTASTMTVKAAVLQEDKALFLHGVLELSPKESLETSLLEVVIRGLQRLGSSPILVPVRGSLIIAACSHLLLFEQVHHDFERINQVRLVVETVITNSISNEGPATGLRDAGAKFFAVLQRESSNFTGSLPDGENSTVTRDITNISKSSAAKHIPLIMTAGRECGFVDRLVVNYPSLTRVNVSLGTPLVARYDDYRIAVSCFSGQVSRLLPEPVSAEKCAQSESDNIIFASPQTLVSVEQDDLTRELRKTEILSGPTMQTRVMVLKHVNDSIVMEEDNQSNSGCYKTRVSVYVSKELAEDLVVSARGFTVITCEPDGLPVSSLHVQAKNGTSLNSEARRFTIGSDGRMSIVLDASPPISARMTVNGTRLRQCIAVTRLEGSDNPTTTTIVFSVLGAISLVLIAVTVLFCYIRHRRRRDDFSVPESLAPWAESFEISQSRTQSTLGSYYYASGELHRRPNGWEGEYAPVRNSATSSYPKESSTKAGDPQEVEERRKTRPVPVTGLAFDKRERREAEERVTTDHVSRSALDSCEPFGGSRIPSLLTATDSYTTSSGDLSSFGLSNRMRQQPGMNSMPGFHAPNGYPYQATSQ